MTTSDRDLQALHYLAQRLRAETHGAGKWDDAGLTSVLAKLKGHNLAITVERVTRHAADADARTPGAIERPFMPGPVEAGPRFPAKAGGDECRAHPGEHATGCRSCAADRLANDAPAPIHRQKPPAEVATRGAAACRSELGALDCKRTDVHDSGHVYHGTTDDLGDHGRHSDETQEDA